MKSLTTIACALLTSLNLASAAPTPQSQTTAATSVTVSYDPKYDIRGSSLNTVACSDDENGLVNEGFSTFGSLPNFPLIGGAPTIAGWNSPNCGACYQLHYRRGNVDGRINVLTIDTGPGGFNIGLEAMNRLTNYQAQKLGRVTVTYTRVADSICGM